MSKGDEPIPLEELSYCVREGDHPDPEVIVAMQKRIFATQDEIGKMLRKEALNPGISPALAAHMMSLLRLEIRTAQYSVEARCHELKEILRGLGSQP